MKNNVKVLVIVLLMTTSVCFMGFVRQNVSSNEKYGEIYSDGYFNGHAYVDLGLPSHTLWATCNVGADKPEGKGYYYAWGEIKTKTNYFWSDYRYSAGKQELLFKYCCKSEYAYQGMTDKWTLLMPEDDAATANWGKGWCTPSRKQWEELYQNTTITRTALNGVQGMRFTASNGKSIFLPAAGDKPGANTYDVGSHGYYWSNTLNTDNPKRAWAFCFNPNLHSTISSYRNIGESVRPVRSKAK